MTFARRVYTPQPRAPIRPATRRATYAPVLAVVTSIPKEEIVRSPKYLRAVAKFDCAECGISGMSQAAHVPPSAKQRKESDLETFPLCADMPSRLGCHSRFDRYITYPDSTVTRQKGREHAAAQRAKFRAAGMFAELLGASD